MTRRQGRGSWVIICRASCWLEGEMAATRSGFFNHWTKKVQPAGRLRIESSLGFIGRA
jgi:hypothetical protein